MAGKKLKLKAGKSKAFKGKFTLPTTLSDGNYYVAGQDRRRRRAGGAERGDNNTAGTTSTVAVAAPFVELSGPAITTPTGLTAGGKTVLPLTFTNAGNVLAKGTLNVQVVAAAGSTPGRRRRYAGQVNGMKLNLQGPARPDVQADRYGPVHAREAGEYFLLVVLDAPSRRAAMRRTAF